jgi:hypothetical protein
VRLNIGCGPIQPDDWLNLDPDPQWNAPLRDLGAIGTATIEGAVAHHVLQMIPWPELVPWLTEVRRVLRPSGYLRLSVPDLTLVAMWLGLDGKGGTDLPPPISDEHETSIDGKVCMWLSQAGTSRSVFTAPWLTELCQRAGYDSAGEAGWQGWASGHPRHYSTGPDWLTELDLTPDRRDESLYVDAIA